VAAYKWPEVVRLEDKMAKQREQLEKRFNVGVGYRHPYKGDFYEDFSKRMADYHDTIIKWRKARGLDT